MQTTNRWPKLMVVAATLSLSLAGTVLAASPADAAKPVAKPARHCVMDVTGVRPMTCYTTFTEAIRQATGGRVTDAPASATLAVRDQAFGDKIDAAGRAAVGTRSASLDADVVISIEYMEADLTGDDQIWVANSGCPDDNLNDVDHSAATIGWSVNDITSFKGYSNCWVKHWENPSFGGASVGFNKTKTYIGDAMNDRTSSIQWS